MARTCLVTGAAGALGSALVRRLKDWDLRVLVRSEAAFRERSGDIDVEVYEGDLSEQEDIDRAIDDADTVFHCACARYWDWGDLIGHTRRLIKAAEEEEKVVDIVFPGNVHVYGDVGGGPVREDQAHDPGTRKGTIRANIERCLREANTRGECRTTIARFPDLYGPCVESHYQKRIFPAVLEGTCVTWPGDIEAEREFIYVEDAAEAMVRLAGSQVSWGKTWHVPGPGATTAHEFIDLAFRTAGTEPSIKAVGKASLFMRGIASKDTKEEMEIWYLFTHPPILDGTRWRGTFGPPPATTYARGVRRTVQWWKEQLDLP